MGRLTIKDKNACKSCDIWDWCAEKQPPCPVYRVYEKLAHYEDMEEAGRLIELPCAMGDTVWQIDEEGQIQEWKTFQAETRPFAIKDDNVTYITDWDFIYCCKPSDFGKTVFLTKEEAEAKLKELEGVKE